MTQQVNADFVGSYVSLDCPDGDIELELCGDGSCAIQKRLWDQEKMQHTDTISKSGVWTSQADALELDFGDLQLRYRWNAGSTLSIAGAATNIAAWDPVGSNADDVIDRVPLLQKSSTDSFLLAAAQAAGTKPKRWWEFWK